MAMHECEAYWQDFLRRPKEQRAIREEQRRLQKEAADRLAALKNAKVKEVEEALTGCTPEQQKLLRPIIKAPGLLEHLHDCLLRSDRDSAIFSKRLETDQALAARISERAEEYERDPAAFEQQEQQMNELHEQAARPIDTKDLDYLKQRTWKDLPPAELAERMSKGEICPREEWIPGISKGKRPLETKALEEHLAFGDRLAREGREAYVAKDYPTAFMRFKQGEELLNWVEAKEAVRQRSIDDMYCMFLRNVAQAALKQGKYQEAIRACTTIIQQLDEHDSKARYRRGRAYLLLGMAKSAKDDFLFILKSPYSTSEGVHAARLGLRELRRVVSRSETEAKATLTKGLSGGLFSRWRMTEQDVLRATFSADTDSEDPDEAQKGEETRGTHVPALQEAMDSWATLASTSEDASLTPSPYSGDSKSLGTFQLNTPQSTLSNSDDTPQPPLSLDATRDLLLDLLDAYTVSHSHQCRALCLSAREQLHLLMCIQTSSKPTVRRGFSIPDRNIIPLNACGPQRRRLFLLAFLPSQSEPVASQLNELRSLADFDYRRVVIRARKFLPQVQAPVLAKHGIDGESHRSNMKLLEKSVSYWRFHDPEVSELTRDCLDAIFGDVADIDL